MGNAISHISLSFFFNVMMHNLVTKGKKKTQIFLRFTRIVRVLYINCSKEQSLYSSCKSMKNLNSCFSLIKKIKNNFLVHPSVSNLIWKTWLGDSQQILPTKNIDFWSKLPKEIFDHPPLFLIPELFNTLEIKKVFPECWLRQFFFKVYILATNL